MHLIIKSVVISLILCLSGNTSATEKSLFWKMESPTGVTSYLFGTMSTDDKRITNISPTIINAIKQVDAVMMRFSSGSDPRLKMVQGFNLEEKLTEEEFDKVRELANYHEMYLENIVRTKPLILASLFFYTKPITGFTQDYLLEVEFAKMRKKIEYIESPQEYYRVVVDSFNIEEQLLILLNALTVTQEEKEKRYQQLIEAYLTADLDAINKINSDTGIRLMPASLLERYREQNHVYFALMTERYVSATNQKSLFIAVRADDLAGDNGLITAFKKAGFRVSPVSK